ncbi:hypothetical protein [Xanthomonas translucens]|uniref:hypothetical protein n=1 Tax=Xanthomonas campestris pv. translucens TaxID=343 RepID=UPI00200A9AD4|nr:hypothetical protein [Xanthomonas translucens]UPU47806.1 hypothetical protein MZO50_13690 [Xanthomonas translucens pv. undulosa]WLA06507.1 hypothetical protein MO329_09655 [Xanthomonas translucens]
MNIDVQDRLYALTWAVNQAREAATTDELVRLNVLPALQQLRDDAQREARK